MSENVDTIPDPNCISLCTSGAGFYGVFAPVCPSRFGARLQNEPFPSLRIRNNRLRNGQHLSDDFKTTNRLLTMIIKNKMPDIDRLKG